MIQLHLRGAHWHIVPLLTLYLLAVSFGNLSEAFRTTPWSAIGAGSLLVGISIVCFYGALALGSMLTLKASYLSGGNIITVGHARAMQVMIGIGVLFTYHVFLCRTIMVSAMESLFAGTLLGPLTGSRVDVFEHPEWTGYWWCPLIVISIVLHIWTERHHLGRAALNITTREKQGKNEVGSL